MYGEKKEIGLYNCLGQRMDFLVQDYIYTKDRSYAVLVRKNQDVLIVEAAYCKKEKEVVYLPVETEKQLELWEIYKRIHRTSYIFDMEQLEPVVTTAKMIQQLKEENYIFVDFVRQGDEDFVAAMKVDSQSGFVHFLRIDWREPLEFTRVTELGIEDYDVCCEYFAERNLLNWAGLEYWNRMLVWLSQERKRRGAFEDIKKIDKSRNLIVFRDGRENNVYELRDTEIPDHLVVRDVNASTIYDSGIRAMTIVQSKHSDEVYYL